MISAELSLASKVTSAWAGPGCETSVRMPISIRIEISYYDTDSYTASRIGDLSELLHDKKRVRGYNGSFGLDWI